MHSAEGTKDRSVSLIPSRWILKAHLTPVFKVHVCSPVCDGALVLSHGAVESESAPRESRGDD